MNIINISLTVNLVEPFNDVPGQQPFTVARCSYIQTDKEGNPSEHSIIVKAFNNSYDKTSSGISGDRLAKFTPGKKILVTGMYWSELRDKDTKQILEQPHILAHSIANIPTELDYNNIYLVGRMITMPNTGTFGDSGRTKTEGCIRIDSGKGRGHLYNFTAWNKTGDTISRFCRVKEMVGLDGNLDFQSWEDKNTGETRTAIKVRVNKVHLMGTLDVKDEGHIRY